jgi:phospholipase C
MAFKKDFDGGKLDGFQAPARGYVPRTESQPYFDMAEQYTFGDRMFQSNEGPSFPAHQYIVSGTSATTPDSNLRVSENPEGGGIAGPFYKGGCDSPPGTLVHLIDQSGDESQTMFPCFDRPSLTDLLDARGLWWRYYQATVGAGLWNGLDAIKHVQRSAEYSSRVIAPSSRVLTDIANGKLANVTWVTPTAQASDHANITDGSGPSWVASVVNAVGTSKYWDSTAIFITWDDWGGWYDHVKPPMYNPYELGFRVPLLVISPYAKAGYVSHRQHEFGSILKFTEETFDLGSLFATDVRADDLSDCFDFAQTPRRFKTIPAPLPASYFLHQGVSMVSPDDDR